MLPSLLTTNGMHFTRRGLGLLATLCALVLVSTGCDALTGAAPPTPANPPAAQEATPAPAPAPTPAATGRASFVVLPSIADLVEKAEPAVVSIVTETVQQTFFGQQRSVGSGSGVIFRQDGYILTNNHVIEGANRIRVTLDDTREFNAEVVGADANTDLAVIKIDEKGLAIIPFGDVSRLRVGDWVVAIGNAAGLAGKPSVTLGVVSALDRSIQTGATNLIDLIQTDAVINPGNSGGPLLDLHGDVVGINSVVLRGSQFDGIGFAISTDTARLVAEQLVQNGVVVWPRLGVGIRDIDQPTVAQLGLTVREGVLISQVEAGGPADRAGLKTNDVIVALDGTAIPSQKTLLHLLRSEYKVGQRVTVTVVRGKDRKTFTLTLGQR